MQVGAALVQFAGLYGSQHANQRDAPVLEESDRLCCTNRVYKLHDIGFVDEQT